MFGCLPMTGVYSFKLVLDNNGVNCDKPKIDLSCVMQIPYPFACGFIHI